MPAIVAYKMNTGSVIHSRCLQAYQKRHRLAKKPPIVELHLPGTHDLLPVACAECGGVVHTTKPMQFKSRFD